MAYQTLQQEYLQIPVVTRAYTTACVLTTAAVVRPNRTEPSRADPNQNWGRTRTRTGAGVAVCLDLIWRRREPEVDQKNLCF
uniref:Uncharacterized protein n=1 Tax=Kryptolebias marmoratus TaxID=37003 RepID=A0A3Q3A4B1_KRYMA